MKDKLIKLLQENLIERKILVDLLREDMNISESIENLDEIASFKGILRKVGIGKGMSVGEFKKRVNNKLHSRKINPELLKKYDVNLNKKIDRLRNPRASKIETKGVKDEFRDILNDLKKKTKKS